MWITRAEYRQLIETAARSTALVETLTLRLNQMEYDLAQYRHAETGRPQRIPQISQRPTTAAETDELDFNDVGDEAAHKLGLDMDATGRVAFG